MLGIKGNVLYICAMPAKWVKMAILAKVVNLELTSSQSVSLVQWNINFIQIKYRLEFYS